MITKKLPALAASCLALAILPHHSPGAQYGPQAFVYDDGETDLGDGTTIASNNGTAGVIDGNLVLTSDDAGDTHSSFRLPALPDSADGWTATFEFALLDQSGGNPPADGFSFSYGAIPAFDRNQAEPTAANAHGLGEEGWHPSVEHISFEVDTWIDPNDPEGFTISHNGNDLDSDPQAILPDGQLVFGTVWMRWDPEDGASMSVDLGEGLTPIFTNLPTPDFTGNDAFTFAISARTGGATQDLSIDNVRITTIPPGWVELPNPVISEFMADNEATIEDEDCRSSDWIEIFNATGDAINLDGWHLTDDPRELTKWQFGDLPLDANAHQLVFASGKDQTVGELHTDFALEKNGGFLALVKPDGVTIVSSYNYSEQAEDISYGTMGQEQSEGAFGTPTPGELNVGPQGNLILDQPVFTPESQVITRTTTVELSLPTPNPEATIRYTTDGSEPNASSRAYDGPITIRATTRLTARIFQPGKEPGPTRDRTYLMLQGGDQIQRFESNLPIILIDSFNGRIDSRSGADSISQLTPVHAVFIDRDPVTGQASVNDLPDFEGRGGMKVRGQTSSGFPKKQYSFETWDSEGNDKDVSIFGYPSESDWVIHAPYSDKTLMRNKIVYETSREIGYPASRTKFCEVFFNDNGGNLSMADYRGVYVFMEKIKRNEDRMDIKNLENCDVDSASITGGYAFKKDKGSPPSNVTISTPTEGHRLEIIEPDLPTSAQRNWLFEHMKRFEATLHSDVRFASPTSGYRAYIDVQSFIDTHIWVEVYKQIDGYRLSSYFFKDRGRKIVSGPVWDYNLSLGNADYLQGEFPNGWYYTQVGAQQYPWYRRLFMDPEFVIEYWDRYFELREGIFATDAMLERIDNHNAEISRAAVRNFNRWRILGSDVWPNADSWTPPGTNLAGSRNRTSHQDEVDWMKGWLRERLRWIDTQHDHPPAFNRSSGPIGEGLTLTISNPNRGGTIYYTTDGSDPRVAYENTPSDTAQVYDGPVPLDATMTVKSRIRNRDVWSPLQTEYYLLDGVPATADNLAVTEINYRPGTSTPSETRDGFDRRGDFEYIEITNIGDLAVDLRGVRFTEGIQFNFDLGKVSYLTPGQRAVVVSNRDAFETRYQDGLDDISIAGEFTNNLSNDGETVVLTDAAGNVIRNFTFNDRTPWPEAADGDGPSLVLIAPSSNPDHNDPLNWRSSIADNGVPGGHDEGATFAGNPDGDDDGNGISNFLQYALAPEGVAPVLPSMSLQQFEVEMESGDYLTFAYTRNKIADDVRFIVQESTNLTEWSEASLALLSRVENGNGTETISFRIEQPVTDADQLYLRLIVEAR